MLHPQAPPIKRNVHIIWDIENVQPPKGKLVHAVTKIREEGMNLGHIQDFTCFFVKEADSSGKDELRSSTSGRRPSRISSASQRDLQNLGVVVEEIVSRKPEAADKFILTQLLKISLQEKNNPTFSVILISGDTDFSRALCVLNSYGIHTLLIHNDLATEALKAATTQHIAWTRFLGSESSTNDNNGKGLLERPLAVHGIDRTGRAENDKDGKMGHSRRGDEKEANPFARGSHNHLRDKGLERERERARDREEERRSEKEREQRRRSRSRGSERSRSRERPDLRHRPHPQQSHSRSQPSRSQHGHHDSVRVQSIVSKQTSSGEGLTSEELEILRWQQEVEEAQQMMKQLKEETPRNDSSFANADMYVSPTATPSSQVSTPSEPIVGDSATLPPPALVPGEYRTWNDNDNLIALEPIPTLPLSLHGFSSSSSIGTAAKPTPFSVSAFQAASILPQFGAPPPLLPASPPHQGQNFDAYHPASLVTYPPLPSVQEFGAHGTNPDSGQWWIDKSASLDAPSMATTSSVQHDTTDNPITTTNEMARPKVRRITTPFPRKGWPKRRAITGPGSGAQTQRGRQVLGKRKYGSFSERDNDRAHPPVRNHTRDDRGHEQHQRSGKPGDRRPSGSRTGDEDRRGEGYAKRQRR